MQIIVKGVGKKDLVPTGVKLEVKFIINSNNYDNTLEKGSNAIKDFIRLIESYHINSEDFITEGFQVKERLEYNGTLRKETFAGYTYLNEGCIYLPYDDEVLTKLINDLSRLKYAPLIRLSFDVDDKDVYELAYKDAILKANNIASSTNLTLKDCLKIELSSNCDTKKDEFINPRVYLNNKRIKKVEKEIVLDCTFVG